MVGTDDGHTLAGWAGCALAVAGAATAGAGIIGWRPGLWLGAAALAGAALLAWGLHLAGWGKPPGPRPAAQRPVRVRDMSARDGHPGCVGCRIAGRGRRAAASG
ncbi:HGxxPAAW family protein [Streptomyces sp. NPDC006422]|uniref:HGxxPAAW family protein n=1 Tax=unclassified Streptomyces TaxID=2593676 RepID=UPI0033B9232E